MHRFFVLLVAAVGSISSAAACDYIRVTRPLVPNDPGTDLTGVRVPSQTGLWYRDALTTLDIVVLGRVVRADDPFAHDRAFATPYVPPRAVIAVERRWKGPDVDTLTVVNGMGGDCIQFFTEGETVVLYADSSLVSEKDGVRGTPSMFIGWREHAPDPDPATAAARLDSVFAAMTADGWDPAARYHPRRIDPDTFTDSLMHDARLRGATGGIGGHALDDETGAGVELEHARIDVFADGVPVEGAVIRIDEPRTGQQVTSFFSVDGLAPGEYTFRISVPGYLPESGEAQVIDSYHSVPIRLRR